MNLHTFNPMHSQTNTWSGWNTPYVNWNNTPATPQTWNHQRVGQTAQWGTTQQPMATRIQPTTVDQPWDMWNQFPVSTGINHGLNTMSNTVAAPVKSPMRFQAPVNVYETESSYNVICELPGCCVESIELTYDNGTLILKGAVNTLEYPEAARHILTEYNVADYYRELTFGCKILTSEIKADFRNGLLVIYMPKQTCSKTTATSVAVA